MGEAAKGAGGSERDGVRGMGGYVRLGQRLWSKDALWCVHVTPHAPDACFSESFTTQVLGLAPFRSQQMTFFIRNFFVVHRIFQ